MDLNNMKCKTIVALASIISASSVSANNEGNLQVEEASPRFVLTYGWVAGQVMAGASSAIKGGVKSALQDAIFGPSSPDYVNLSEESLQQIEDIVQSAFDNAAKEDMIRDLRALEYSMKAYSDRLDSEGIRDLDTLANMESESNKLYASPAFNTSKPYYTDITVHYSAAAAFRYAILADRVHFKENSITFIESAGTQMATYVEAMGAASDKKIAENVYLTSYKTTQCQLNRNVLGEAAEDLSLKYGTPSSCYDYTVTDNLDGSSYRYRYQDHGGTNSSMANNKVNSLTTNYLNILKGEDYQSVIDNLQHIYN
ncbi:hypothetical protein CXF83_11615 [Shewanella sp. Choline-02u-19]|nr:hypothetical protein CXF82_01215 [Shewanella sp. GutDb-MelDb]PKH56171.1 hypothetical protein CXF84_14980 [Shewanella sp. Bg11-22]PKI27326.1 hypothetical protein CXF83_11615 [Shewanella sp. Choline-02u-19]